MDEKQQTDWLEQKLEEAAPYIDDAGFTFRVLQQLPARRAASQSLRAVILVGITLLASAIAYFLSGGGRFVASALLRAATLPPLLILLFALGVGILVTAIGTAAAISKNHELQS
jgi:hypothetical protein